MSLRGTFRVSKRWLEEALRAYNSDGWGKHDRETRIEPSGGGQMRRGAAVRRHSLVGILDRVRVRTFPRTVDHSHSVDGMSPPRLKESNKTSSEDDGTILERMGSAWDSAFSLMMSTFTNDDES